MIYIDLSIEYLHKYEEIENGYNQKTNESILCMLQMGLASSSAIHRGLLSNPGSCVKMKKILRKPSVVTARQVRGR